MIERWVVGVFVAGFVLSSCGWFSSSQAATATAAAIDRMAEIVRREAGKDLDEVPVDCEVESNPKEKEILMLCTVSLKDLDEQ